MLAGSGFGDIPGMQVPVETFEQAFRWGNPYQMKYGGGVIAAAAQDPGNTPVWELRPGLILGQQTASGQWVNYSPTNTDGSQIAAAILVVGIRLQDVFTGVNTQKFIWLCFGGNLRSAGLIGLDAYARQSMRFFQFDDILSGNSWFAWKSFITKTAAYQILVSDNFTLFDNTGATGSVTLTLPAIANGLQYGISCRTSTTFALTSNEGGNVIADTLTRSTVSVTAIGGSVLVFSNPGATAWIVVNQSPYNQVVSFS